MNETSQTRQITCGIQAWNKSEEKNNLHGMLTLIKGTVHYSEGALAPTGPILVIVRNTDKHSIFGYGGP